jgi:predicted ATPase/class 3 adenylate cyclase
MTSPSGDVTLLFTDIEGSTRLWETHPDAMAKALRRHDAVLRRVIESHRGYVFKTVGDAFCAAFATAVDAVGSAVEIQRALSSEPWPPEVTIRVRMGLHSGACEERDGDYFGPEVNRTARLEAAAHGGQIVVSATTAALLATGPTPGVTLVDLGEHRLKDLTRPERVAQVAAAGLAAEFPPLRSLSNPALRHNLPQVASSFVGRQADLARLTELLATTRLVTLTGPGGTGKTRLALQAGAEELDGSVDGVWFCDLSLLSHPDAVAREVASVLSVPEVPGHDPLDTLAEGLATRSLLLVLDNCEHLLAPAAALVDRLLAGCPGIVVLVTSREPLSVTGEHVLRVPPLGLPADIPGTDPLAEVLGSEAATLFVARARAHDDRFVLDEAAAPLVAAICRRLDGLPLALELAAARLRTMSLGDLEARLGDHLRVLRQAGGRTAGRQQTITALIDWSHRLLSEVEQAVFARLSVFAGPFGLPAAMAAGAGDDLNDLEVEDAVFSLVDKSLLVPEAAGPTTRYRYLESIRQFAAAHLEAAGAPGADGARGSLVAFYAGLAAEAEPNLFGPDEEQWFERLDDEQPNVLIAFEYAAAGHGLGDRGLAMGAALYLYWLNAGPTLGVKVLERALSQDAAEVAASVRAKATWVLAEMCVHVGRTERGEALATEAFTMAERAGEPGVAAQAMKVAGTCALARVEREGGSPAIAMMNEALQLAKRSGDELTLAFVINDTGNALYEIGDYEGACSAFVEALQRFDRLGSGMGVAGATINLGTVAEAVGDLDEAYGQFTRSFEVLRRQRRHQVGHWAGIVAMSLASILARRGNSEEALEFLAIGLRNAQSFPPWESLRTTALVAHSCGETETALKLHGAASAHLEAGGASAAGSSGRRHRAEREVLSTDESLDVDHLYNAGRQMHVDQALALATEFAARQGKLRPADSSVICS